MEQSVGQNVSMNHAAELDQILASYKVCVNLIILLCQVAWVTCTNTLCRWKFKVFFFEVFSFFDGVKTEHDL